MRYYKNLFHGIVHALHQIHAKNEHADQVVANTLKKNKKWGSNDRSFVAETIYNITRYRRLFYEVAGVSVEAPKEALWKVLAVYCVKNKHEFPRWEEFSSFHREEIAQQLEEAIHEFVLRESIPDWLHETGKKQLDDLWEPEIIALNEEAEVVLRMNPLAFSAEDYSPDPSIEYVQNSLRSEGAETIFLDAYPEAIQLVQRRNIQHTKAYEEGLVEIQDANSQLVAPFTNVKPGMKVIDACAGAGGKSLHLAALMNNKGEIIAFDLLDWKLKQLRKRAKRAEVNCIQTETPTDRQLKRHEQTADVVLIDAPCSGLGTLKRKADLKWKISPDFIDDMIKTQQTVLTDYAKLVKPGGVLVYATCSILPEENQEQVQWFLHSNQGVDFKLDDQQQLFAHKSGYDGFYMARLRNDK